MTKTYYIGLDVHKDSIAIAYTHEGSRQDSTFHGTCGGTNLAAERALRGLAEKLGVKLRDLKVCYEAGPSGFVLARRFQQVKIVSLYKRQPVTNLSETWHGFHLKCLVLCDAASNREDTNANRSKDFHQRYFRQKQLNYAGVPVFTLLLGGSG